MSTSEGITISANPCQAVFGDRRSRVMGRARYCLLTAAPIIAGGGFFPRGGPRVALLSNLNNPLFDGSGVKARRERAENARLLTQSFDRVHWPCLLGQGA